MGRKDRLRQEKQARQCKIENAAAASVATTTTTGAQATPTTGELDREFPKSESYVQTLQSVHEIKLYGLIKLLLHGATEYGCIHSMRLLGKMYKHPKLNGRKIHEGQPWLLEGSIRGSIYGVSGLIKNYCEIKRERPQALASYWIKMQNKYHEWSGTFTCNNIETASGMKSLKDNVMHNCASCFRPDTEKLTLQCIGCSMYCYCSEACQTIHWGKHHRGECKQIQILTKYHKPYAKEIRKAAIRGETHPALKKLRNKLGLTRPLEKYQQLCDTNKYEGKQIDPLEYIVARSDGSVWIGSTPAPIGTFSDTSTPAPPPTTTTTTSVHDEVPVLYGIGGNNRPSIQPGRTAIIHNLQSKTSAHLNSTHCIIRKILRNGRVAVEVVSHNNNDNVGNNNSKKLEDTKTVAILPTNLEMV